MPLNQAWLDKLQEPALDPDYPIVDPHHHMWLESPRRGFAYPAEALARDAGAGHNIVATVFIQCTTQYREAGPEHLKPVGETEWVNAHADDFLRGHPGGPQLCAGIVAATDFRLGEALTDEVLAAHRAAAPSRFRGIRQSGVWTDDAEIATGRNIYDRHLYLDPAFRRGFSRLAPHGLSFDAWLFHPQLAELTDLARAFPGTPIVVNHLGAPLGQGRYAGQREAVFADWKKSIAELARCPNVHMKLGGSAMHMFGFHWERRPLPPTSDELAKATAHFYHAAIDAFAPARCMFESNFPVDKMECAYVPLWNSFKKIAARYSDAERADLFGGTARRFYRL
jgi:predicted TIM-barrel fold metal-dependent hydrolase